MSEKKETLKNDDYLLKIMKQLYIIYREICYLNKTDLRWFYKKRICDSEEYVYVVRKYK